MIKNKIVWMVLLLSLAILLLFYLYQFNQPKKTIAYFDGGEVMAEYFTVNNYKHGEYLEYFEDGEIKKKLNYNFGALEGLNQEFYPNGKIKLSSHYDKGLLDGLSIKYDDTGDLSYFGHYLYNLRIGSHYWYYPNSIVKKQIDYDSTGFETGYYQYLSDGEVDSLAFLYILPLNENDSIKVGSEFKARVFLGNRVGDSVRVEIEGIYFKDSVADVPINISQKDYYTDISLSPSKPGLYYISGNLFEYHEESFDALLEYPFDYTFYVLN